MAQRRREFGGIGVTKGDTLRRVARHLSSQFGRVVELADTKDVGYKVLDWGSTNVQHH